jgi:putative transposase
LEGKLKNVIVSRTKSGRYSASFQVEVEIPDPVYRGSENGLDLGLKDFAALSDGRKLPNPRHLIQAEKRLRRLQRSLSRRQKGSAGWERQRQKVARQHEKVADCRADYQHKMSRALVEDHRLLAIEDLHIKGMMRNKRLAKQISDAGWGQFVRMLGYKGEWYGCELVAVDRFFPSSKTCWQCGSVMKEMPLELREWDCPNCQAHHDRDVNAAKNLLNQATVGTTGSAT